jgi:hypothetical protein
MRAKTKIAVTASLSAALFLWLFHTTPGAEQPVDDAFSSERPPAVPSSEPRSPRSVSGHAGHVAVAHLHDLESSRAGSSSQTPVEALAEDDMMIRADRSPEQREWRATFATELQDDDWTQRMRSEVNGKANAILQHPVRISGLSCRETICRMVLEFRDRASALAFMSEPHDAALRYHYQSHVPCTDPSMVHDCDRSYEVLISRERPADLRQHALRSPEVGIARPIGLSALIGEER